MGWKTWLHMLCFDPFKKVKKVSDFTCGICMETLSPTKKFSSKKCSHPFCVDCISKYIVSKVQDSNSKIKCPSMECNKFLEPLACRPILPDDCTFERWCYVLCESFVLGFSRAYCPYPNCSELVLNECGSSGGAVRETKCPSCRRLFCFHCKVPWHAGFWCDRNGPWTAKEDVLFDQMIVSYRWKRCPRCEQCVERVDGCSVVKCRCRCWFCFKCGAMVSWFYMYHGCN